MSDKSLHKRMTRASLFRSFYLSLSPSCELDTLHNSFSPSSQAVIAATIARTLYNDFKKSSKMDNNAVVQPGSYPIYILGASSDPEETQASSHHSSFSMQFPSMAMEPSFPHIKRFIVPKNKQPDDKNLILASPLISWLQAPANAVDSVKKNLGLPPYVAQMLQETNSAVVLISKKFTLPDGTVIKQSLPPYHKGLEPSQIAPLALHLCLSALCHTLRETTAKASLKTPEGSSDSHFPRSGAEISSSIVSSSFSSLKPVFQASKHVPTMFKGRTARSSLPSHCILFVHTA